MALFPITDARRTDMSVNEKDPTQRIASNTYYPRPILNPATHRMSDTMYQPDHNYAFASNLHSTEPFFRSLPMKEQDLWWEAARSVPQFTGKFDKCEKRDLPMNFYCRLPPNAGKWPRIKTVNSEPTFDFSVSDGTTMSATERKHIRTLRETLHARQVMQSVAAFQSKEANALAGSSKNLVMNFVDKVRKKQMPTPSSLAGKPLSKRTAGRPRTPGVGEIFVATSLIHYQKARSRDIDLNKVLQSG
eukprot:GEMP01042844.1.p1 GENE.GEMP01042844.1~~GEMP01042844.1.p1  ORF type:complete len:246 (+),score=39.62 GEMP01042844.1:134-871(+)